MCTCKTLHVLPSVSIIWGQSSGQGLDLKHAASAGVLGQILVHSELLSSGPSSTDFVNAGVYKHAVLAAVKLPMQAICPNIWTKLQVLFWPGLIPPH